MLTSIPDSWLDFPVQPPGVSGLYCVWVPLHFLQKDVTDVPACPPFSREEQEVLWYTAVVGPTQILSLIMRLLLMEIWVDEERGGCLQPVELLLF